MSDGSNRKILETPHRKAKLKAIKVNSASSRWPVTINPNLSQIEKALGRLSAKLLLTPSQKTKLIRLYFDLSCYDALLMKESQEHKDNMEQRLKVLRFNEFLDWFLDAKQRCLPEIGDAGRSSSYVNSRAIANLREDLAQYQEILDERVTGVLSPKVESRKSEQLCRIVNVALNAKAVKQARNNKQRANRLRFNKHLFAELDELYTTIYQGPEAKTKGGRFAKAWRRREAKVQIHTSPEILR